MNQRLFNQTALFFTALIAIVFFYACEREFLNPYDRDCPPEIWTPENLEVELINDGVALSWDMDETHFDGFMVEMSEDGKKWEEITDKLLSGRKREYEYEISNPDAVVTFRICAIADKNTSSYCESEEITLPSLPPTLATDCPSDIDLHAAILHGELVSDGGGKITERGFCYSKFSNPDIEDETIVVSGTQTGQYAITYSNFELGQTYYVKAYAINSGGVGYGEQVRFTTKSISPEIWAILAARMPIYTGDTPPDIEGAFFVNPFELVYSSGGGYEPGDIFGDANIRFTKSGDCNNTYLYDEKQGSSTKNSNDVYLDGDGNNFVAYYTVTGLTHDISVKQAVVISGTITPNGIQNFYYAFYMVEKGPDPNDELVDVGTYRIFKDGNGMADYTTWTQSAFKKDDNSIDCLNNDNKLNEK